ncbi:hypothetical protein HPO96_06475 [Kribbella sandramycini]|uniref:Uncharacterized protein n=1 Tax=Kribbella sandramycini TaxID=60450 RepID=A0A7Y4KWF2_9ACTN|nr:hypothetical protein [Kribbella sandramycini]MBB6567511.1 hypothetical protein [Kribbella sandramycini]NOL39883.1 hypothetical protein [Kribbella sandramycini]
MNYRRAVAGTFALAAAVVGGTALPAHAGVRWHLSEPNLIEASCHRLGELQVRAGAHAYRCDELLNGNYDLWLLLDT